MTAPRKAAKKAAKKAAPARWGTNTESATQAPGLTPAAKKTYNTWGTAINNNKDPKTAASTWDSDYEVLKTKTEGGVKLKYCSIRLTQEHRVYFVQNDTTKVATIKKIGTHNPPTGF